MSSKLFSLIFLFPHWSNASVGGCDTVFAIGIDFSYTGTFTITPRLLDASSGINTCQITITHANGAPLVYPVTSQTDNCEAVSTFTIADYQAQQFLAGTDFQFTYKGIDSSMSIVCESTRTITASFCVSSGNNFVTTTYGYAIEGGSSPTLYVGRSNHPAAITYANCIIEVLEFGSVPTFIQTSCDTSLVKGIPIPSDLTPGGSRYSFHIQLVDVGTNAIKCTSALKILDNVACVGGSNAAVITDQSEYQADGSFLIKLSETTTGFCDVFPLDDHTNTFNSKLCNSLNIPFYASEFSTAFSFGSTYQFLLRDTDNNDPNYQTCATIISMTPTQCGGSAELGIDFDPNGVFTLIPRNIPGTVNSCRIIMTSYHQDSEFRVNSLSTSCSDTASFSSTASPSQTFGLGGTFAFSLIGYDENAIQVCASENHVINECSIVGGNSRAQVFPEYTGDGDFVISGSGFKLMNMNEICQYEITQFDNTNLLESGNTPYRVDCDAYSKGIFINGVTSGYSPTFAYNSNYSFRRRVVDNSGNPVCYSTTKTITTSKCQNDDLTFDTDLQVWHDTVNVFAKTGHTQSLTASQTCRVSLIQGSTRLVQNVICSDLTTSESTFSQTGLSDLTTNPLRFSFQAIDSNGDQMCATGGTRLVACSNSGSGASFGIGTDFAGNFFVGISKSEIGYQNTNRCRVEMLRANGALIPPITPVQIAVQDCDGSTISAADYSSVVNSIQQGSDFDFRIVRMDNTLAYICASPIRTLKYTQCADTEAIGWVDNGGDLVVTYADIPDVTSGQYSGMTCSIESLRLSDNYEYQSTSCGTLVARFTSSAYSSTKEFLFHGQVSSSNPSIVQCATPTYKLIDTTCQSVSYMTLFDDNGKFDIYLSQPDTTSGITCEFIYLTNGISGDVFPINRVQSCESGSFTESVFFQFDQSYKFKYRRVTDGSVETCSVPITIDPTECKSASLAVSTLDVSHTIGGMFTIRIANPPDYTSGEYCYYYMSGFDSVTTSCTDNMATIDASQGFIHGQQYSVRFTYFSSDNPTAQACTTTTIVYADCATADPVRGWYSGDGDFSLQTVNFPTPSGSDKCRFEFLVYNGDRLDVSAGLPYVDSADCSGATFIRGTPGSSFVLGSLFSIGSSFEYRVRVVSSNGAVTTCYSAVTSGTATSCGNTGFQVSLESLTFERAFSVGMIDGIDPPQDECQISVLNYASNPSGAVSNGQPACASATFSYTDAGLVSAPSPNGYYRFGFMLYDPSTGAQGCASSTLQLYDCSTSGDIAVQYNGIGNFIAQPKSNPGGQGCTISMTLYAGSGVSLTSGSCAAESFTQEIASIPFAFNTQYVFNLNVFLAVGSCVSPSIIVVPVRCASLSSGTSILSAEWRADGSVVGTVSPFPNVDSSFGRILLYSYNGQVLAGPPWDVGFGPSYLSPPSGTTIAPGSTSTVVFTAIDNNTPTSTVCATAPATVTFYACAGGSIELMKYPFSRILVKPTGLSSGSEKCVLRTYGWGTSNTDSYIEVDCSNSVAVAASGYGTFSGLVAKYSSSVTDYANSEPLCVTQIVSTTVTECNQGTAAPIALNVQAFNTIRVTYDYDMSPDKCALFIKRWNSYNADMNSNSVVFFEDTACSLSGTLDITTLQIDNLINGAAGFSFAGTYEIEFAAYSALSNPGDSLLTSPACASSSVSIVPTVTACDDSTITPSRIDGQSVRITVDCSASFGYTSVSIVSYSLDSNLVAGIITQSLPITNSVEVCQSGQTFDFWFSTAGDYPFYTGDTIQVTMFYYGANDIATVGCQNTISYVIEDFSASLLPTVIVETTAGVSPYTFRITKQIPFNGGLCTLTFDCGTGLTGSLVFSTSCNSPLENIPFYSINEGLTDGTKSIPFNTECLFSYTYVTTQHVASNVLSPADGVRRTISPPPCRDSSAVDILLTPRFTVSRTIEVAISAIPDTTNMVTPVCELVLIKWSGYQLSSPYVTDCSSPIFAKPGDPDVPEFLFSTQPSILYGFELYMTQREDSVQINRYTCVSSPSVVYNANTCLGSSNTPTTLSLIKHPDGVIYANLDSIPNSVQSCQIFFDVWKTSQAYGPTLLAPCTSLGFDAGGASFNYADNEFNAILVGYTSASPDPTTDVPLCGTTAVSSISPLSCGYSVTATVVGYNRILVQSDTNAASGNICVFFIYTWNGVPVASSFIFKDTVDCISGVEFTSDDTGSVSFEYDALYSFGLAVYSTAATGSYFSSNPVCSFEPFNEGMIYASVPTCPSSAITVHWIDISEVTITLQPPPATYGKCLFTVDQIDAGNLVDCSSSYTYTSASSIAGETISVHYKYYAIETNPDLTNDVICVSNSRNIQVNDAFGCSNSLTRTIANDYSSYSFEISQFSQSNLGGSCKLIFTCNQIEQAVEFTTCASMIFMQFFEISDLFSGSLGSEATCSVAYDYYAASDSNTPFCRSTASDINLLPPDCLGASTQTSPVITVRYEVLGNTYVGIDNQPVIGTGFSCRIGMIEWAGTSVSPSSFFVADCPIIPEQFQSYPSGNFLFGSTYKFVVEVFKTDTGSLFCRSTNPTVITTTACADSTPSLSTISLHQFPFSQVDVFLSNGPSSDISCVFYILTWNGQVVNYRATEFVSCYDSVILDGPSFTQITSGSIEIMMVKFSSPSSSYTDQPECGTAIASISPNQCSDTPSTLVSDYGEITLSFQPPLSGTKCLFYVTNWNGDYSSNFLRSFSIESPDCSSVSISSTLLGYQSTMFSYDSVYTFEYAVFASSASIRWDEPLCTGINLVETAPTPQCSGTLSFSRIDGESVSFSLSNHPVEIYGACQVVITAYAPNAQSPLGQVNVMSLNFALCVSGTEFSFSSTNDLDFADSASISYVYEFYADEATMVTPTCTSITFGATTIPQYSIGAVTVVEASGPTYTFSLANPPTAGTCVLNLSCDGGKTGTQNFPCQSDTGPLDFMTISTAVGYIASGTVCQATVDYYTTFNPSVVYSSTSATDVTLSAPVCAGTAMTASFKYDGAITVFPTDPPPTDSNYGCRITVLKWAGSPLENHYVNSCDSAVDITGDPGASNEPSFRYGELYEFVVQQYRIGAADLITCQSAPVTWIIPPTCNSQSIFPSIIKYPFDRIKVFAYSTLSDYSQCVFFITSWAGTYGITRQSNLVDCYTGETIGANDVSTPFAYGTHYSVQIAVFASTETNKYTQPYCGFNMISTTPALCPYSLILTNSDLNTIRAVIDAPGPFGGSCQFIANTWDTTDLTTTSWYQLTSVSSSTCSGVNFVGSSIGNGLTFTYGASYSFEYAEYDDPAPADYSLANPTCSISAVTYTSSAQACGSLSVTRNDGQTVFVTMSNPHFYGTCIVDLLLYNGEPQAITSAALPCNSKFYFTYSVASNPQITFAPGDTVQFQYTWYPDGSTSYCSSQTDFTLGDLSCGPLTLIYDAPDYVYTFSFSMQPLGGECLIYFSCDSGVETGSLLVSDCSQTEVTSLNQLNAYLDDPVTMIVGLNSVCSFWYTYTTSTPAQLTCSSTPTDPGVTIQIGSTPCKSSGASKALTVATPTYFADGSWSIAITHAPTRYSDPLCRILITRWAGQVVRETYVNCDTNSATTVLTVPASVTGPSLVFGEKYSFLVQYVKSTDFTRRFCDCATRTIVPALCQVSNDPSSALVNLNLVTFPFGALGAGLSRVPSKPGKCNYYLQTWSGALSSITSSPVACGTPVPLVDPSAPFIFGTSFKVMMIQFPGTATSVQPLCGLNPQTTTPTMCSSYDYKPTLSAVSGGRSVMVGFPPNLKPPSIYDCFFFVNRWNGVSKADPNTIFVKKAIGCDETIFTALDVGGIDAAYGTQFGFEFSVVSSPSGKWDSTIPLCTSEATIDLVIDPKCDSSKLAFSRIDSNSIRITITDPLSFATCTVTILQDGSESTPRSITGGCAEDFDFHSSQGFNTGNEIKAQFEVWNGATLICESNPEPNEFPQVATYTAPVFTACPTLVPIIVGTSIYPQYRFAISEPKPYHGTCVLKAECSGTFYTVKSWTACTSLLTIDFTDINRAVSGTLVDGDACRFKFTYTSLSESETCSSPSVSLGPLSVATCSGSGGNSGINIAYTGTGSFSLTVSDPPSYQTSTCRIDMTEWDSGSINSNSDVDTDGSCTKTFSLDPPSGSSEFTFGTRYSFQHSIIDQSDSYNTVLCKSDTVSLIPPVCESQSSVPSSIELAARPGGLIHAGLQNHPIGSSICQFHVSKWNGVAVSSYATSLAECKDVSVLDPPGVTFGYSGDYSVRAVVYDDFIGQQPICGTSSITRTFRECTGSLSIAIAGVGSVLVSISGEPAVGSNCVVYLEKWGDSNALALGYSQISRNCKSVTFSENQVGIPFTPGLIYAFSYARFESSKDTETADPFCSSSTVSTTLTEYSCPVQNLQIQRPDPLSILVSLLDAPSYGACRFTVKSSPISSRSLVTSGDCRSKYAFSTTDGIVEFSDASSYTIGFSFFDHGIVTGVPTCSSAFANKVVEEFPGCRPLIMRSSYIGTYTAEIDSVPPSVGICQLVLVGFEANPIRWSSCSSTLTLTYEDILDAVGADETTIPLGSSMSFVYHYYATGSVNDQRTCTSVAATSTVVATIPLSIVQTPISSTKIKLSIRSPIPTSLTDGTCTWEFIGCDEDASLASSEPSQDCTSTKTFENAQIQTGAACAFRVFVSLAGGSGVAGDSGHVTFYPIGPPVWTAIPSVDAGPSSDCLTILWEPPTDTGGSPLRCYKVDKAVGALSDYTFPVVTCARQSPQNLVPTFVDICDLQTNTVYKIRITAITSYGSASIQATDIRLEYLQCAPESVYTSLGSWPSTPVTANSAFPTVTVQARIGSTNDASTNRIFVSELITRSSIIDSAKTLIRSSIGPPRNAPPTFSIVLTSSGSGIYTLTPPSPNPSAGLYSFVTHSLEAGGLRGTYWLDLDDQSGTPDTDRKDTSINFSRFSKTPMLANAYRGFFVRWTGFIEPEHTEPYVFTVYAGSPVRLFVNGRYLIDTFSTSRAACSAGCSMSIDLTASDKSSLTNRKFTSIRVDMKTNSPTNSWISLYWSSEHTKKEIVPPDRLFQSKLITDSLQDIQLASSDLSPTDSLVSYPETFIAGQEFSITVTAKDAFGNVRSGISVPDEFTAMVDNSLTFTSSPILISGSINSGKYSIAVTLSAAGTYLISVVDNVSGSPIGSSNAITVSSGSAALISNNAAIIAGSGQTAGSNILIGFRVTDGNDNLVPSSSVDLSKISLSATWTSDSTTSTLIGIDEFTLRQNRYGSSFTPSRIVWNPARNQFVATFKLLHMGSYLLSLKYGPTGTPTTKTITNIFANENPVGSNCVLVASASMDLTTLMSNPSLTVGTSYQFSVQLRDRYLNAITSPVSATVKIMLDKSGTSVCSMSLVAGQYDCSITPQNVGTNLRLAITVEGSQVSLLSPATSRLVPGPWLVSVTAGSVDFTSATVSGLKSIYIKGIDVVTPIVFRDTQGNVLTSIADIASFTVTGSFSDGSTTELLPPSTVTDNGDGTFSFLFKCPSVFSGYSMTLSLDDGQSSPVSINSANFPQSVNCQIGPASPSVSTCTYPSSGTAGDPTSLTCTIVDDASNQLTISSTFVATHFINSDPSDYLYFHSYSGNAGEFTASGVLPSAAGAYDVFTVVGVRGGLIAMYFADNTFTSLIGNLVEDRPSSTNGFYYTRIDTSPRVSALGFPIIDGLSATSIRWTGVLTFPATDTFNFKILYKGAFSLTLLNTDGTPIRSDSYSNPDPSNDDTQTYSFSQAMTSFSNALITLDYTPFEDSEFSITWNYASSSTPTAYSAIPSRFFQAPLRIATTSLSQSISVDPVPIILQPS